MKIAVVGLGDTPSSRSRMLLAALLSIDFAGIEARYMSTREYEEGRKSDVYFDECLGFDPKQLSYFGGPEQLSPVVAVSYDQFTWGRPTIRKPKPYYQRGRW